MLPSKDRLYFLFEHYLNNHIADDELKELFDYIRDAGGDNLLQEEIMDVYEEIHEPEKNDKVDWETMYREIISRPALTNKRGVRKLNLWRKVAAAVLILIIGGTVSYFFMRKHAAPQQVMQTAESTHDILPGGNRATLTLSNGRTIILNNANNGMLASAGNINVIKVNNGMISYKANTLTGSVPAGMQYNTLTVPRGGQYQLTLSDGTRVWLNAASSIRYPVAFMGKQRAVEVTGEVYFEVAKDAAQPFIVKTSAPSGGGKEGAGAEIQVLGTHFDVNAYGDENTIKVTLLEGLIKVRSVTGDRQSEIIHPGEQAQLKELGTIKLVKDAHAGDAIAWKNGFFSFRNDNLGEVMRKLSRWYNVDVIYKPGVDNKQRFSGRIDRNLTLSQVLKGLELTQAHFKIEENRKLEILP